MISRMSTTRVPVVFSRESTRQPWCRRVVTDDWTASRNCDVENVYEWVGYSFFYVRFVSESGNGDGQGLREEAEQRPVTPGLSDQRDRVGYGGSNPPRLWSVVLQRWDDRMVLVFRRVCLVRWRSVHETSWSMRVAVATRRA